MEPDIMKLVVPGEKPVKITKWKVRQGTHVSKGVLLALYQTEEQETDKLPLKLKAPDDGFVKKICVKEGQLCQPGANLLEIEPQSSTVCTHPTVMKDMCAECGADLRCELGLAGDRKEPVQASVAMVHCIPELIVSEEVALELGKADENRLLESRKLALLVDLDQTLIHTTNDSIPNKLKDVYHFQLWHGRKLLWYHTKFRPGTKDFLKKISEMYELHICTFGVRMYAHTIARFIDPDGKYFSHRILSRDECFDAMSKTANLKALFPCGDCMVAIIDDREDVWNYAPNLIHVKPYHFFQGTADINAPPGLTKTENDDIPVNHEIRRSVSMESVKEGKESATTSADAVGTDEKQPDNTTDKTVNKSPTEVQTSEDTNDVDMKDDDKSDLNSNKSDENDKNSNQDSSSKEDNTGSTGSKNKEPLTTQVSEEEEIEWVDDDDYLYYLTDILTRIHKAYYDFYDQMKNKDDISDLPNMKNVIPYVKRKVLKGVNIVFSGIVPLNMAPEKSRAYVIAKSLGATIHQNIILPTDSAEESTTHLIASKAGTAKYKFAKKLKRIKIVNLEWLMSCSYRWERVDERLFPVTDDLSGVSCESPVQDLESLKKRLASFNPLYSFSDEDIECMDKEVENLLDEDDDGDSDEDEEERDQRNRTKVICSTPEDSSTDDSLQGNFPKGWKKKSTSLSLQNKIETEDSDAPVPDEDSENELDKYQKNVEAFSPESEKSDTDKDSIGSVDDEIADAVEKEFLSML
ncbi:hypothetical protein LOTGIDRAFT_179207 [Lottia gigantea]|uniref:RNA polymerase II subunit A C-terminal domain phosphatase n=1 Tax=Lottia gigantea TaxID=225164 RepID=V3ZU10_LOTGI|nr:hypothetical protein LOTGIDRAFT_179207 [Lottia gigantea]ESO87837.1 hypothetical protein LOTGIDRAFT_179207 [Lottia gigantea]